MTVLKDLAVETIFALFLDHFLYYCVFVVIILFLWYFLVFYAPCKRNYIFNLHWNSCSHFYKSCKMTGSVLLSWSGWWILSHQHTYYMGCWWCHEPNESDSCGLNGGNMLCSMCFLWSAFRFFIFISFFFGSSSLPFWQSCNSFDFQWICFWCIACRKLFLRGNLPNQTTITYHVLYLGICCWIFLDCSFSSTISFLYYASSFFS